MRKYTAGAEPEKGNRDRQESKVIEQNHREQARQAQLQEQGGEAAQGNARREYSAATWRLDLGLFVNFRRCGHRRREESIRTLRTIRVYVRTSFAPPELAVFLLPPGAYAPGFILTPLRGCEIRVFPRHRVNRVLTQTRSEQHVTFVDQLAILHSGFG